MQICRAEDGQVFQINMTLYDIAKYVTIYVSDGLWIPAYTELTILTMIETWPSFTTHSNLLTALIAHE